MTQGGSDADVEHEVEDFASILWLWVKKGSPKKPIGKRKNRPKPVVPRVF